MQLMGMLEIRFIYRKKVDDFNELGWPVSVIKIPERWNSANSANSADLSNCINNINTDCIIAQMPLRNSLSSFSIDVIPTIKDCDGLTSSTLVLPATVRGIVDYLDDCGFKYEGKNALILGRSNIVGKPMAKELLARNMTVSICHSKTDINAKLYLARIADLVVSAVGDFTLTREACPHAIVVDVGIRKN
jgi:methylenetetrahydrofolate dehydrogenase (NADP+) / methenyltetrahydrofolate cyclohydrolase